MFDKLPSCFHTEKKQRLGGLLLAVFFLVVYIFCYNARLRGPVAFFLFAIPAFLQLPVRRPSRLTLLYVLWSAVCIAATILFPLYEIFGNQMIHMMQHYTSPVSLFRNALLLLVFGFLFLSITGKWRLSLSLASSLFTALVIVNGYVFRLRGKEFLFSDIFAATTAMNVAGQYSLALPEKTFTAVLLLAVLLFAGRCLPPLKFRSLRRPRLTGAAVTIVLTCLFLFSIKDMHVLSWKADGTLMNGYHVNLYLSIRDHFVDPPENYSDTLVSSLEEEYPASEKPEDLPNVLVIMNESFADLRVFGGALNTNIPVTPYLDSLEENTIRGSALASVYGGGTANSEFECLSGFTMQFFPTSSTPYQQYIHSESHNLTWVLKNLGYDCMATHPYLASGWGRPAVYPRYGFDRSTFIDSYPNQNLVRNFVSDQEMYEYLLEQLNAAGDAPLFLFGITMQNHGGYGEPVPNYTPRVFLEGYSQEYPQAEEYLSLMNYSDEALEYLLTQLQQYPEDTVVLFFGDHLPGVEKELYEELYGGSFDTLDSQMLQYTVPFFIWANYDIPEQEIGCTSLNYLGRYLLEAAGIPLPPYYQFLKEAERVIPAVNAFGYYSRSGQTFQTCEEAQGEEALWLSRYESLQYNGVFDKHGRSDHFFGNHIGTAP